MIYSDFFTQEGRVNSMKVKESWVKKHHPNELTKVNLYILKHNLKIDRFVEKLWYFFNNITDHIYCKKEGCLNTPKFKNLEDGYLSYCSSKCSNSASGVKQLKVDTCIKKFGTANPYQSIDIIKKIKKTNLLKYGHENAMQSNLIKEKMIDRSIKLNGVSWTLSNGGKARKIIDNKHRHNFELKYSDFKIIKYSKKKFGSCVLFSEKCGHEFEISKLTIYQRSNYKVEICTICNPLYSFSETTWQVEIEEILIKYNINYSKNNRSIIDGFELDFYLPEYKIAIELNGIYWHSIKFKDSNYHLNKTEMCEDLGIQLIHVFEDEWIYKKDILVSTLIDLIGLHTTIILANDCKIKKITNKDANQFIKNNYIYDVENAKINYGLFYKNEIVSILTARQVMTDDCLKSIDGKYEILSYCTKINLLVKDGESYLMSYFTKLKDVTCLITFDDRRWSNGKRYYDLGFKLIRKIQPTSWYIIDNYRVTNMSDIKNIDSANNVDNLNLIFDSGRLLFENCLE